MLNPWADYRIAPDALDEIDLCSDTDWTLSIDGGPPQPIKVTGGGWNSDRQEPQIPAAEPKDHVIYERKLTIRAEASGNAIKILFGGCNYGAEVFIDGRKVTEHHGPLTPFEADLTGIVGAGRTYTLRVKAFHRFHYGDPPVVPVPFDFTEGVSKFVAPLGMDFSGQTKFAYGLTGHVRLVIYPLVYIRDVFVRPSVKRKTLSYDVWIANADAVEKTVELGAKLTAWDEGAWDYLPLPPQLVTIPAGATKKITIAGILWTLGPESFWWPNIPYGEHYRPTLHSLNLTLAEDDRPLHTVRQRFGFVEHAEGPYYYTVNGVRITTFGDTMSYGHVGEYDCWTETPCFQPPHGSDKGCAETWRRYQRIGFNSLRVSTSVPTRHMLETADEAGFLLIAEGGSWGNKTSRFTREHFPRQLKETIVACRNHPCVVRYSLANESIREDVENPDCEWRLLIDAALEVDDTRPLVFEVNPKRGAGPVRGMKSGHAMRMQHYDPIERGGDFIRGMGEVHWLTDGMGPFALTAIQLRLNDYAHLAPWSWINYWPNFLEGMSHARHPWKVNNHPDRRDGVDGWGSPVVESARRALDPYLLVDLDLFEMNPEIRESPGEGSAEPSCVVPLFHSGQIIERRIEVFNGGLEKQTFAVDWTIHWDAALGAPVGEGKSRPVEIEAGHHTTVKIAFPAPAPGIAERKLFIVMRAIVDGRPRYVEARNWFRIREK